MVLPAATAIEKQLHCQLLTTPPRSLGLAIHQSATLPLRPQETLQLLFKNFLSARSDWNLSAILDRNGMEPILASGVFDASQRARQSDKITSTATIRK